MAEEEIIEDIVQSSKDKQGDEKYSDDFISDHITESIPSY